MVDDGRNAMSAYCKAQAQINEIDKETDEVRKSLNERIRTYRSLLQDSMETNQLTCIEVPSDHGDDEPVYVRLKQNVQNPSMDYDFVMEIMRQIDYSALTAFAEKQGRDLPRMLTHVFSAEIKQKHSRPKEKMSLSISKTRERGFERQPGVPTSTLQMANSLIAARGEMTSLKQKASSTKRQCVEEQKEIEDTVKAALRKCDPVNMTARVHMMQNGNEWVYYLRCKEKEKAPTLGVRRVMPMVEAATAHALSAMGLGREFTPQFRPNPMFWETFGKELSKQMDATRRATKRDSRLSLDRGAPRAGTKVRGAEPVP